MRDSEVMRRYPFLPPSEYLRRRHILMLLRISPRVFAGWLKNGRFPQPDIVMSKKLQFWGKETVNDWKRREADRTKAEAQVRAFKAVQAMAKAQAAARIAAKKAAKAESRRRRRSAAIRNNAC